MMNQQHLLQKTNLKRLQIFWFSGVKTPCLGSCPWHGDFTCRSDFCISLKTPKSELISLKISGQDKDDRRATSSFVENPVNKSGKNNLSYVVFPESSWSYPFSILVSVMFVCLLCPLWVLSGKKCWSSYVAIYMWPNKLLSNKFSSKKISTLIFYTLFICILKSQRTNPARKWTINSEGKLEWCTWEIHTNNKTQHRALAVPSLCCFFNFCIWNFNQPISMYSHLSLRCSQGSLGMFEWNSTQHVL